MNEKYKNVLSVLSEYIGIFSEKGYNSEKVVEIIDAACDCEGYPLFVVKEALELDEFELCTVVLGLLVSLSRPCADVVSDLCGAEKGCFTPEFACEFFMGRADVFSISEKLTEDSAMSRLFDGVKLSFNAQISIKKHISYFILTGKTSDVAFVENYIGAGDFFELSESKRAISEIKSAFSGFNPEIPQVVQVCGNCGTGRRTIVRKAFSDLQTEVMEISFTEDYLKNRDCIKELALKLVLLGRYPVIVENSVIVGNDFCRLVNKLADEVGLVFVITEKSIFDDEITADMVLIKINNPSMEEQVMIWQNESISYNIDKNVDFSEIASEFDLTVGAIKKAMRYSRMFSHNDTITSADIKNGCYRSVNSDMGSKATKINCVFGWDDIVLPENSKKLMKAACSQVKFKHKVYEKWGFSDKIPYGKSVSMIFTGPPGTGKTMGAQIIAAELGLDIYRVSLANVVSKYIGETEKNLEDIFEKSKKSKVVLFFDEADVLFSKRTEVKDSNDKYSNMESAFLLQKIEEYNGVVILATNLVQNFDEAFKRRMKFLIEFPFPDKKRSLEMWKKVFPSNVPLGVIDYEYLVDNFELSGSNIKNIALYSAFLAASDGSEAVEMKHIIASLKNEYSKSGKAFTKSDAGEYYYYLED